MGWQQKSYNVSGAGSHTLKWVYVKDGSVDDGDDCGWVDCVQWTGSPPIKYPDPADWDIITYGYDPAGRRIKKTVDDQYTTKYCYDGGNVIAEYDYNNNLLRKYIHGPGLDEPVCMIDAVDNDAEYYYHYDGLGSVVALSDSAGDTVQTYEYSVYGQVAAEDPDFLTNPYMFTGRRFDLETGLYYYRARYYNPHIGRFMQTDPVGYSAGINLYLYCSNNPLVFVDPSGFSQIVTGRYVTMPGSLYPGKAMGAEVLSGVAALVVNIIETTGTDKDPRVGVVKEYLDMLGKLADAIPNIVPTNSWRAFIEVYDSEDANDRNGDGIIDENERGEQYWIEVVGFRMPGDSTACYLEGAGYDTWGQAADAGGSLVDYAQRNGGVIPDDVPAGWLAPSWEGSPYLTDKHYDSSSDFLNAINTANSLIDKIQEIKDMIEEIIED